MAPEDAIHRYYRCPDNDKIEDDHVQKTRDLVQQALATPDDPQWTRGITRGELKAPKPYWLALEECKPWVTPGFLDLLLQVLCVGTD